MHPIVPRRVALPHDREIGVEASRRDLTRVRATTVLMMPGAPTLDTAAEVHPDRPTAATLIAWALFVLVLGWSTLTAATSSFTERPLLGDQASFVLQTISLTEWSPDLAYDEADLAEWSDLRWTPSPNGLFLQRHDTGYAAAKPYGVSAAATPLSAVFGLERGMALTNAAMLLVTVGVAAVLLRRRYSGTTLPLVLAAFTVSSALTMYLFILQPDLFLAAATSITVLLLVEGDRLDRPWLLIAAMVPAALLIAERTPIATLIAPLMLWVLWRAPAVRHRALCLGTLIVTWGLLIIPYLHYSDGASWTAYGGDRLYLLTGSPWPPPGDHLLPTLGSSYFTESYLTEHLGPGNWDDAALALLATVAGRHTGMIPWAPMVLGAIVLVALTSPWRRPRELGTWLWGAGIVYLIAHAVLLPEGYYGGGATIGNKYLVHITPVFIAALALSPVSARAARLGAGVALSVGLLMTAPHLLEPDRGLEDIEETTVIQRLLPFEDYANPDLCHRSGC